MIKLRSIGGEEMDYHIRNFKDTKRIISRDLCDLAELLHPSKEKLPFDSFSVSHAILSPHSKSLPHKLVESTEIYIVIEGAATLHLNQEKIELKKGTTVVIPASAEQYIVNDSDDSLELLCIVTPPWSYDDEIIN